MEAFASSFHSLSGTTIGERRKNLYLLLNRTGQHESAGFDFSLLQPRTSLEENFKVEALIYFRRTPDLVEVLKSENPILIARVLKIGSWFWEGAFQNITGEQLVTLLFPLISFNAKVKVINKLSLYLKNPQQGNSFFEALQQKYGLYLASKILPSCTADFIVNSVKVNRTKLTPRQLIIIIQKYPEITETLFKELSNKTNLEKDYKSVFNFIAKHDVSLFLKLFKEYNLTFRLGWRITNKFIQKNKQEVIKNPQEYYKSLHNKQIPKSLNKDFNELYFKLFPKSLTDYGWNIFRNLVSVLKELPQRMRNVNLFLTNFERAYGTSFWDYRDDYQIVQVLKMLPVNERYDIIKIENKPSGISEEKWMCFFKTEISIPFLKKTISLTSDIRNRAELITLLVKTCKLNEDKVALAEMCKHVVFRHRNDNICVRLAFLNTLQKQFKLAYLDEQHWKFINELLEIFVMNEETFDGETEFLEYYIHFCLLNNVPIKEQLTKWLKVSYRQLNIIKQKPQYEKQCLLMFAELIPELYNDKDLESRNIQLLSSLIDWNKRHREDQFSLYAYPDAFLSVKRILHEEDSIHSINDIVTYCVRTKTASEQRTELLNMFLSKDVNLPVMNYLIRYEPLTVLRNLHAIERLLLDVNLNARDLFLWKSCKYYTHIEIPQKVTEICLKTLEVKPEKKTEREKLIKNAITVLSNIISGEEFRKFAAPYYPSGLRADLQTDEGLKTYKIQHNIYKCLKNLKPASLALESILLFCKGDYLKLIQSSLYSVSGNVNEDKLPSFFSELAGRAVSTRKHAMHLTFRLLDKNQICSVLNSFMETEKNPSIRKFIFKSIFNFFVANPSDYFWEMVKLNVNAVDVKDKEALNVLMQVDKIPREFFVKYILFTWDFLNKLPKLEGDIDNNKNILLRSLEADVIQVLPKEFCSNITKNYFFKCEDGSITTFQSTVQTFICRYIIYCSSLTEQEERLKSNFEVLKDYVKKTWHNSSIRAGARKCVANFLNEFCLYFLSDKYHDACILIKFADLWNSFLKPHEAFNEYLHLQFTIIYLKKLPLPQLARELAKLCDSLINTYGRFIINVLSNKIAFFTQYYLTGSDEVLEENRYVLIESLLEPKSSIGCLILVISMLNQYRATIPITEAKYKAITEALEKNSDPAVQLHLQNHFVGQTGLEANVEEVF